MMRADGSMNHSLLYGFSLLSLLLFGFLAWKPRFWALLTPFRACSA